MTKPFEMLSVSNLTISFGSRTILKNISVSIDDGDSLALMGPSGCGKSTLLKAIAGLISPFDSGKIVKDDRVWQDNHRQHVTARTRSAALVLQEYAIWPHLSVREQLELVSPKRNTSPAISSDDIMHGLSLGHLSTARARTLSGGEKQRLAIGRALRALPEILLMDEPFNALDEMMKIQTIDFLLNIQKKHRISIILSTHEPNVPKRLGANVMPFGT